MHEQSESESSLQATLADRRQVAAKAWRHLLFELMTITPGRAAQLLIIIVSAAVIIWLVIKTWVVLAPLVVGLFLAYLLLPLVQILSRYIPRWAAVLIVFVGLLLVIGLALSYLVPPLIDQIAGLLNAIPAPDQTVVALERWYKQLPPQAQEWVSGILRQTVTTLRTEFFNLLTGLGSIVLNVLDAITFIIGLLVVPLFLYYVLMEQVHIPAALDRALPPRLRPDFWAVARIVDRNFSGYLRSQVVLMLIATMITFVTLRVITLANASDIQYSLVLSVIVGLTELIPYVGVVIGTLAAISIGALTSWQAALLLGMVVFIIKQVAGVIIYPILAGRSVRMSEALIIVVLIILSEFGLIFAILAPPIAATFRDLTAYIYARLGDPPLPAGLLPGDSTPAAQLIEVAAELEVGAAHGGSTRPMRQSKPSAAE